jgi:nitrate reductase gamma subunit
MTAGAQASRSTFGDAVLVSFLIAQLCDGALTYIGVQAFGHGIEANPIVGWYMATLGVGVALFAAKSLAMLCAALLYRCGRHRALGALTIFYFVFAVAPWVTLLASID